MPNRVAMMPMGSDFAGHTGELTDEHIKYYELRARGGTGLIIVENVCVKYPEGSNAMELHSFVLIKTAISPVFSISQKPVTDMAPA